MAAGIDWLRWHHGTVSDAKFQLVAKRTGASVAEVVAVWATLMEAASQNAVRGELGVLDFEAIDCALGIADGRAKAIHEALSGRNMIADGRLTAWEKRQPKREREDDGAAERKRRQREREASAEGGGTDGVTAGHATSRQKTPRGEESREEETGAKEKKPLSAAAQPTAPTDLNERKAQRLAQVTADAAAAYNTILARPNGVLASVHPTVGKENRQRWVARCLTIAAEICQEQFGSKHITPEFWAAYFGSCKADPFKSGQQQPGREHANWAPTFEYLTRPKTMLEVFDKAVSEDIAS